MVDFDEQGRPRPLFVELDIPQRELRLTTEPVDAQEVERGRILRWPLPLTNSTGATTVLETLAPAPSASSSALTPDRSRISNASPWTRTLRRPPTRSVTGAPVPLKVCPGCGSRTQPSTTPPSPRPRWPPRRPVTTRCAC